MSKMIEKIKDFKYKLLAKSILSTGKNKKDDKDLTHISAEERAKQKEKFEKAQVVSPSRQAVKNFFSNRLGVVGLIGLVLILLIVFVGSAMLEYDPYYNQGILKNISPGSGYMNVPGELIDEGIKKIAVSTTGAIGLSNEGNFYVWGHEVALEKPIPEEALNEQGKIKDVAAGDLHFLVLTDDNNIIGWGDDSFSQTEYPREYEDLIKEEGGIRTIAGGDKYSVLITEEGTLRAWGATLPTNLRSISSNYDKRVKDIAIGSTNILALLDDGSVTIFGTKGSEIDTLMPEELKDGSAKISAIGRASNIAFAVGEDGQTYAWGARSDGANRVPEMEGTPVKIGSARTHISVLTDKGYLYAWGDNHHSQSDYPTDDGYVDLYSGFFNSYGIKEDGKVNTWGLDGFIIGSDEQGRDLFTRIVHGGKMTLLIALVSVAIQVILGVIVGVIAGFYGGKVDNILMRIAEIIASFPFYPLIITISSLLPAEATQYDRLIMIMVILGVLGWTGIARLVRGEILSEREKDYITAAKALGVTERKIMTRHMIPNIISIIIVQATLGYASNLLTEAGLSFLGFGVKDPYPSWGNMLSKANESGVLEKYWWRWVFPGLSVFLTALTVNLVGDALRDAMDPKAQER